MRQKLIILLASLSGLLIAYNLYVMFLNVPDEVNQGAAFRIIYFHVPSALTSFIGFYIAMGFGIACLVTKNLKYDSIAASINEVSIAFATVTLITGMIWGRIIWGIWWAWDGRLTSYFICLLIYSGYMMMRRAIDEPTQRAKLSAVLSIFACLDIVIVWKSIDWWRTQHPQAVLSIRDGGGMSPGMESPIYWNLLALSMMATALVLVRMRQEDMRREIDALRRYAHAM